VGGEGASYSWLDEHVERGGKDCGKPLRFLSPRSEVKRKQNVGEGGRVREEKKKGRGWRLCSDLLAPQERGKSSFRWTESRAVGEKYKRGEGAGGEKKKRGEEAGKHLSREGSKKA